jgi:hypothetical protein
MLVFSFFPRLGNIATVFGHADNAPGSWILSMMENRVTPVSSPNVLEGLSGETSIQYLYNA